MTSKFASRDSYIFKNFGLCLEGIRGIGLEKVRVVRDAVAHFNGGPVPGFEKIDGI